MNLLNVPTGVAQIDCPPTTEFDYVDPGLVDVPGADFSTMDDSNVNGTDSLNQTKGAATPGVDDFNLKLDSANATVPVHGTTPRGEDVDPFLNITGSFTHGLTDWATWLGYQLYDYAVWFSLGLGLLLILVLYLALGWICCHYPQHVTIYSNSVATNTMTPDLENPSPVEEPSLPADDLFSPTPQPLPTDTEPPKELSPAVDSSCPSLSVPPVFALASLVPSGFDMGSVSDQAPLPTAPPLMPPPLPDSPSLGALNHRRPASLNLVAEYPPNNSLATESDISSTTGKILYTSI